MTSGADGRAGLDERFAGPGLDPGIWVPSYLPHWSSTAESAATHEIRDSMLHLTIPPDQGLWCAELHVEPLRVSCIQSATFSGPLGSPIGPQPFRDGLVVREEQQTRWGYTPRYGHVEVRMRAVISPRSMAAFWLSGIEDQPERSGEICVAEVFGDAVDAESAAVGMGVHRFRDPDLTEEFGTERLRLDVADFHTYAVDWRPDGIDFAVDGRVVRRSPQSPDYPVQLMLGVFDFPAKAAPDGSDADLVPELVVDHVLGHPLAGHN